MDKIAKFQMAQLVFYYGTMNSSKTANLLMMAHTLRSQGKKVILIKPSADSRNGKFTIKSRVGLEAKADLNLHPNNYPLEHVNSETLCKGSISCTAISIQALVLVSTAEIILVDEAQFLSPQNVEMLRTLASCDKKPVLCYGLLTDYRSRLFPGSKRLVELADQLKEITYDVSPFLGDCCGCKSNKAIINSKFTVRSDGKLVIIKDGSSVPDLGSEEKYKPLCWNCWNK